MDPMHVLLVAAGRLKVDYERALARHLEGMGVFGITGVQATMIVRLGDGAKTFGQLMCDDCYIGTNASHNKDKLVADGWWIQEAPGPDRRRILIRNSEEGLVLCRALETMQAGRRAVLAARGVTDADLAACARTLRQVGLGYDTADIAA